MITFGLVNKKFMLNGKTETESSRLSRFYYPSTREVAPIRPLGKLVPDSWELFSLEKSTSHDIARDDTAAADAPIATMVITANNTQSFCYSNAHSRIAGSIRSEMQDPKIDMFRSRNLRQMTFDELERFDPTSPMFDNFVGVNYDDDSSKNGSPKKKRKACAESRYHFKIGKYASSTYYCQFLSENLVRTPGGRFMSVREMTEHISKNPRSTFRAWFCMPLFKVVEIADRFILEGWLRLSHHCRTLEKLQIKAELLIMGSLAMIGGTVQNFRQLHTVTNIYGTDHSKFF